MALKDDISALAKIPLLSPLNEEQLRILAFASERIDLADGQELFREGANADSAYIVQSGTISVEARSMRQAERFGCDSVLGELSLIATTTRPGTAKAVHGPASVLRLNRSTLRRVLEEYPPMAAAMHEIIRQRLQVMTARIGALGSRFEDRE
ncbi:cyclic nucleotide-binding domain-containing protein [Notoacmeibacter ruber]|uniref:Crp/Fnr family transcriptional regulator n=1 Tax=Notoacmeibacter ruber TaxID=2670375 RepID=A0A3L7JKH9_9HYPH|nr:Crp/Fnr family transcriptional regulator [Notoacmeibacter ruber]RLQ89002.1 Crp/Fnr family transcriptional regulator [Notoacmeibacter ruber]